MQYIAAALIGIAVFFVLEDVFHVPLNATFRAFIGLERQMESGENRINTTLEKTAIWLSRRIRLNDYKKAEMEGDIRAARLNISPEMYMANAIVKAGFIGIFAIPMWLFAPILAIVILGYAVVRYFAEMQDLPGRIKEKRAAIDRELPRFVATIEKNLRHNQDTLQMLIDYEAVAGPALKYELEITVADMRSGNFSMAISRLEARVGLPTMTEVCRGLLSVIRGDDTEVYWKSLELKLEDHQRELLRAEADKVPKKVNRCSMFVMFCFTGIWMVTMFIQIFEQIIELFS